MIFIYCYLFYIFSIVFKLNGDIVVFESTFKIIGNRYFWYYDYITFASQKDFLEHISETYPEFINKVIFIRITGEFNVLGEFIRNDPVKIYKVCLPPTDKPKSSVDLKRVKFSSDEVTVRYSLNGETTYECDGRVVPTLQNLAECALKKRHQKFGPTCQRTSYQDEQLACTAKQFKEKMSKIKLFCESIDVIQLLNYRKSSKRSTFSDKIWSIIWKDRYSYGCFSLHNYRLLRERYIREINAYRSFHKVFPLTEDYKLTQIAQARAMALANYRELLHDPNRDYEEIIDSSQLFTAPLLIKRWYNEINKYKFRFPLSNRRTKSLVEIIRKNTTYLGIGIVKSYCHVIVVVKFPRREKKFTKYIYNIKKRLKNG